MTNIFQFSLPRKVMGLVLGVSVLLGAIALPASAQTSAEATLLAQIAALQAQIAALQAQVAGSGSVNATVNIPRGFRFTRNLTLGSRGNDVMYLQRLLNMDAATQVNIAGRAGGAGTESTYFGTLTRSAVVRFQNKYASEVLIPVGLTRGTGFVGVATRAKLNAMLAQFEAAPPTTTPPTTTPPTTTPPTTTPPTQTGAQLSIAAGTQPVGTLAPQGAARVPFTSVTLSNPGSAATTITGITAEFRGLGSPSAISGVVLLDSSGNQIGTQQTFNANRQARIATNITLNPGQSMTLTIAANMAANLSSFQGQSLSVAIVGIDSNAAVTSGSLPIIGGTYQANSTLTIGTATVQVGTVGTVATAQQLGATPNFSSLRLTAGSAEDLMLRSIRWRQDGSAAAGDIVNVAAVVDGVRYPATVSSDGRYYTTTFGSGILITKGTSKEISLTGTVQTGSGRSIQFNIERASDINVTGQTYGYGVLPTAVTTGTGTGATAVFTTGTPFYSGATATISSGTLTVTKAASVAAQNIGINQSNQILGGFTFDVTGEPITIQNLVFTVTVTRTGGSSAVATDITSVSLYDQNGTVIAGPVDVSGSGTSGTLTYTTSITLREGMNTLTLRGRLGSTFQQGDVVTISVTPSTQVTNVRGDVSAVTITPSPSTSVAANQMTVRNTNFSLTTASTPVAQTVVAGAQNFLFAQYQFDTTNSSDAVRISSLSVPFTHSASPEGLTNCQLYNASGTSLTTGTNVVNPTAGRTSGSNVTFTFDTPLTLPANTITTISLRCNISGSVAAGTTYSFGTGTAPSGTGVASGSSVTGTVTASSGQTMTIASGGSLTVTTDASSPSYHLAAAGSTDTVNVLNVRAGNEALALRQIGLQLSPTTSSASSTPGGITSVTLWGDNGAQIGSALFTGTSRTTTVNLTSEYVIPANSERRITIRATFAQIGTSQSGTEGALIRIDYDGDNASQTQAVGQASGTTVNSSSSSDTASAGVRVFRSIPTVALDTIPNTTLVGGDMVLMRFRVTANANGDIGIDKFTLNFATSTASVSNINIFAYTDAGYSTAASTPSGNGMLMSSGTVGNASGDVEIYVRNTSGSNIPLQVPAGSTRYFEVRGSVTGATTGSSVTTKLMGDSAYPSLATLMGTEAQIDADTNDNFIWSPNSTTTATVNDIAWTNGYGVPGLPSSGLFQTLSR